MAADAVSAPPAAAAAPEETARASSATQRFRREAVHSTATDVHTPADWIERIRALRRAGKSEDADRELRAFQARHPDYELPEDLKPARASTAPASTPGRE